MNSVPQPGPKEKFALLWATNKPLAIGIIVGIVLLILAIVFVVVFFTVIRPGMAHSETPTSGSSGATASTSPTSVTPSSDTTVKSTNTLPSPTTTTTTSTTVNAHHHNLAGFQKLRSAEHLKAEWFNWGNQWKNKSRKTNSVIVYCFCFLSSFKA